MPGVDRHRAMKDALEEARILVRSLAIPYIFPAGLVVGWKNPMPLVWNGLRELVAGIENEPAKLGGVGHERLT